MRILVAAATLTALSMSLLSGGAEAARTFPPAPTGGPSGPALCTAACIVIPPRHARQTVDYKGCGDHLAELRRVTAHQIARVDDSDVVHLVPLCDTVNHSLTEEELAFLSRGNVQGLLPVIAQNDTLMSELDNAGYDANDVLGVAFGPDAAILYVSHRG